MSVCRCVCRCVGVSVRNFVNMQVNEHFRFGQNVPCAGARNPNRNWNWNWTKVLAKSAKPCPKSGGRGGEWKGGWASGDGQGEGEGEGIQAHSPRTCFWPKVHITMLLLPLEPFVGYISLPYDVLYPFWGRESFGFLLNNKFIQNIYVVKRFFKEIFRFLEKQK